VPVSTNYEGGCSEGNATGLYEYRLLDGNNFRSLVAWVRW